MENNKRIFISHCSKDKKVSDELVRLLQTGLDIARGSFFCSSLPSMIGNGFSFVSNIKDNLKDATIVVLLLSRNYFASQFCLEELGASLFFKDIVIPIVVPPVDFSELKAMLSGIQSSEITKSIDLDNIADEISKIMDIGINMGQWSGERDSFLRKIIDIVDSLEKPEFVTANKYAELQKEYDYQKRMIIDLEYKNQEKEKFINELEKLKNASEVLDLRLHSSDFFEQLMNYCEPIYKELTKFIDDFYILLYYFRKFDTINDFSIIQSSVDIEFLLDESLKNNYIIYKDGGYRLNTFNAGIKKLNKLFEPLCLFIRDYKDCLEEQLWEKYSIDFSLNDLGFWERCLNQSF